VKLKPNAYQHYTDVSGHFHAPAPFIPIKIPQYALYKRLGEPHSLSGPGDEEEQGKQVPVVQFLASRFIGSSRYYSDASSIRNDLKIGYVLPLLLSSCILEYAIRKV
jgi:hypothetical protein